MRHVLFIILLTASLANTVEAEPNLDQTREFLNEAIGAHMYRKDVCWAPFLGSNIKTRADIFLNTLYVETEMTCEDGLFARANDRIDLTKITHMTIQASRGYIILQFENYDKSIDSDELRTIATKTVLKDINTGKSVNRDEFTNHLIFKLGIHNEENYKVAKRIFNALKHYSKLRNMKNDGTLPMINLKFKDELYKRLDGSEFD